MLQVLQMITGLNMQEPLNGYFSFSCSKFLQPLLRALYIYVASNTCVAVRFKHKSPFSRFLAQSCYNKLLVND